ncbi:MAG: SDR family NAD(P)-dependent oxidoreductase [Akkermansia sp.]|nr:SDR family NAD(P)-dependent oxidoreductase [Akkermansia sp.]
MLAVATAVITGASSGFGEAFARHLAGYLKNSVKAEKVRMVLIARSEDKLNSLADELRAQSGCDVMVCPCDLADPAARAQLVEKLGGLQSEWMMLINNAGLGDYGEFISSEPERNRRMIEVNMTAPVELTRAMLPSLLQAQKAFVINIASLAADLAIPDFAMYAASKSFVASFSEALRIELKGSHVHVTAVCPGPVHTSFGDVARRTGKSKKEVPFRKWFYTSIPCVVESGLRAVLANKPRCYPSLKIRLAGLFVRNAPLWVLRLIMSSRPRRAVPAE